MTKRLRPHQVDPETATEGNTLAVDDTSTLRYIESSVPVILLPAGSDAGDVPADTPIGTIVLVKA